MLRPGFPRLSHPGVAHAIPSIASIARVYPGARPVVASPTSEVNPGRSTATGASTRRAPCVWDRHSVGATAGRPESPAARIDEPRSAASLDAGRRGSSAATTSRARGPPGLRDENQGARAGDEAREGRAAVGRPAARVSFHRRGPRRFSGARASARVAVQQPHRDAADRCARRGQAVGRIWHLWAPPLLHDVASGIRAHLDQDGQAATPEPKSLSAVGLMRSVEVLFAVRTAQREG